MTLLILSLSVRSKHRITILVKGLLVILKLMSVFLMWMIIHQFFLQVNLIDWLHYACTLYLHLSPSLFSFFPFPPPLLFSPLGSYQRSISEDAAGDSSIVRVSARDADSGTNAVIEYLITDVQTVGVVVSTDEQVHNNELGVGGCQGFYPSHTNLHKFASE